MLPIISYLRSAPTKRENNNVHTQIEQKKKDAKNRKRDPFKEYGQILSSVNDIMSQS